MSDLAPGGAPPTGLGQPMPPQMVPNPAFEAWAQQAQAWIAEKQRREQEFTQACELISGDAAKRFKIDIEADSTIAADEQAEKQARVEFLTAVTPFLETVLPQMAANPALAPLGKELVLFAVRGFRVSRQLEDAFETALDKLTQMGPQQGAQEQGGKNTKSPAEIQTEAATEAGKQRVQEQANAIKAQAIQSQTAIAAAKLQQDQIQHEQQLALEARNMTGREQLDQARILRMESRAAEGLV